jgi:hypothetical protein
MKKINIPQIITLTMQEIRAKPFDFIRFGFLIFVMMFLGRALNIEIWASNEHILALLGVYFIVASIFSIVLIGCHRTFLMSDADIKKTPFIRFGYREWNFIAWWIILGLIAIILFALSNTIVLFFIGNVESLPSNFVFFISSLPLYYIISRLSLVFPATAVKSNTQIPI